MDNDEKKHSNAPPESDKRSDASELPTHGNDSSEGSVMEDLLHVFGLKRQQRPKSDDEEADGTDKGEDTEAPPPLILNEEILAEPEENLPSEITAATKTTGARTRRIMMFLPVVVLVFALGVAVYRFAPIMLEPKPPSPDVVAEYNGNYVTIDQLQEFIRAEQAKEREHAYCPVHGYDHSKCDPTEDCETHPIDSLEAYREMVNRYAVEKIIADWAEAEGITSRQDVQHGMEDLLNDASVEQYISALHSENITPESISKWEVQEYYSENQSQFEGKTLAEAEADIRQILVNQKDETFFDDYIEQLKKTSGLQVNFDVLKYDEPTEAEISAYYQANMENYVVEASAQYSEITLSAESSSKATEAIRKIRSGESFDSVAKTYSITSSVTSKTISQSETSPVANKLWKMQSGEISEPITNDDGTVSIVRLDSMTKGGYQPLATVSDEIKAVLSLEKMEQEYSLRKGDLLFSIHSRRYTLGEFFTEFKELSPYYQSQFATFEAKKQLVEQMIAQELLLEESSDDASSGEDHSMEELRVQYLWQIMHKEMVDAELPDPTDEEIEAFYNENPDMVTTPASVEINLIWIDQGENGEKKEQALTKANEALAAIKNGTDFAEVAKSYSEDTSATNGGEISGKLYKDHLAPQIAEAAFSLGVGEVSEVIDYYKGYYIIQVRNRYEAQVAPLDEVRDMIKSHLSELAHEEQTVAMETKMLEQAGFVIYEKTLRKLVSES